MKTQRRLAATVLTIALLLGLFGGGAASAAAPIAVTTGGEVAYVPLGQGAGVAYERHEAGYAVSLDRGADGVTMRVTAAPGDEAARAPEKAQLYIRTGAELKAGAAYQVSFSLAAEQAQPEYAVSLDGAVQGVYGTLTGRGVKAGGVDRVRYLIPSAQESGELILRLLLGKTGAAGNTLRVSGLTVEEVSQSQTTVGQNAVLVDELDYSAPGFIRSWTNDDSAAVITADADSATLTVTKAPADAEVWKIKLLAATGLKPQPGKTYSFSADVKASAARQYEICYNEGDTEKGYDVLYGQKLTAGTQRLERRIYIPRDKANPGELIVQLSLGLLKTGDTVTISNVRVEEEIPQYTDVTPDDFRYDDASKSVIYRQDTTVVAAEPVPVNINWSGTSGVTASGDYMGALLAQGNGASVEIKEGSRNLWDTRLNIDTGVSLKAGMTYRATFRVQAEKAYSNFEVLYGTALSGVDNNRAYGGLFGCALAAGAADTLSYTFSPAEDGGLLISLQVGATEGLGNKVTVSDFVIEELEAGESSGENLAQVYYPGGDSGSEEPAPEPSYDPGSFSIREDGGHGGDITGDGESATVTCIGGAGETWQRGLWIRDLCDALAPGDYEISLSIEADQAIPYRVCYNNGDEWADGQTENGHFGMEEGDLAVSTPQTVVHAFTVEGDNQLLLRIDCGMADTGARITVRDIQIKAVGEEQPGEDAEVEVAVTYPDGDLGTFSARDALGRITGDGESAVMVRSDAGESWQWAMFTGTVCRFEEDAAYEVSFAVSADKETTYDVLLNKNGDWGDGEGGFARVYDQKATPDETRFTQTITAAAGDELSLRIDLGKAEADAGLTVRDLQVRKADGGDEVPVQVEYPTVETLGSFEPRDKLGTVTGDGSSATMTWPGQGVLPDDNWRRALFINEICDVTAGVEYEVSFAITGDQDYTVHFYTKDKYEGGFDQETVTATGSSSFSKTVTPEEDGKLTLRVDPVAMPDGAQVTVGDIRVKEIAQGGSGGSGGGPVNVTVKYPSAVSDDGGTSQAGNSFESRDGLGDLTGDGSSATLTWPGKDVFPDDNWRRALFINEICDVTAGANYEVSFDIVGDQEYVVRFFTEEKYEQGFASETITATDSSRFSKIVTPEKDGKLTLRVDPVTMPDGARLTIRDVRVTAVGGYTPTGNVMTVNGFGAITTELSDGYTGELERNSDNVVFQVTKGEGSATWKAKLHIPTGLVYEEGKSYRVKFDLTAENSSDNFCVITKGVPDSEDIRGTWGQTIAAGQTKTITTRPIPAGKGSGELGIDIELGVFNGDANTYTVSNVVVEEVETKPYSVPLWERSASGINVDTQRGYLAELTRAADSATLHVTQTPSADAEAWKMKLFLDPSLSLSKGSAYRVTFDMVADNDMDFEVTYNRGGTEKGYDAIYGLHATAGAVKTVEKVFTAETAGNLIVQLSLGMVKAPNNITVRNLQVERISYTPSGVSALPEAVDYQKASGDVTYWAHEDYAVDFVNDAPNAITAHILAAPEVGAEPWKIKLFLDTRTALEAGKYYKVTAELLAAKSQDFEICYNNGGVEFGYDSLGGLRLVAGEPQTVERIISVPVGKTDLANLMLQINLGKTTEANDVTVSGVTVEEVALASVAKMPADFAYTMGGTVDLWLNPDYTATADCSDGGASVHITQPAADPAVWKVKLFVNTGAALQPGRTYLVSADMLAANAQRFEICYNNEEIEKGYDALYDQPIEAGETLTVERKISVPETMTDAGELILQFAVGGAVKNDITISNVSVQELDFGTGAGGKTATDTVIDLRDADGKLEVTREKLSYQMSRISAEAGDNAVAVMGADLRANDFYTVAFTVRADKAMTGLLTLKGANGGAEVISRPFQVTTEAATYYYRTDAPLSAGGLYDILWQFGGPENQALGSANVEISDVIVYSPPETLQIMRSTQNVTVNGRAAAPEAYAINGYNYFKLRDLAMLLNDTDAQFVVRYNEKTNRVSITTGKTYTPIGGELTIGEDKSAQCIRSPQTVEIDGRTVQLKAYAFGGYNYFRVRDLSSLLGYQVDYAADTNTVVITSARTPEAQEQGHAYDIFFQPEADGEARGFVGDTMPYYEDGTYYIYYLKEGGDAYNHSAYLVTTTDFVHYNEVDDAVLSASREDVQDSWIGTGSVVKVDGSYYFFYTGFNSSGSQEYHEKIMVAKSSSPTAPFAKVAGWEIVPPAELGQKNDFRDPQAYYDPASQTISLTVTASQDGRARILKYTLDKDLKNAKYDGIIYTDPTGGYWNLECSDTFRMGDKWYLTYSGQDDTLWYAMADSRFGPYTDPARLDGKIFYAAKHVEDGQNTYMVGWARRSNDITPTQALTGWAGNLVVQKLIQKADGSLALAPVDNILGRFTTPKELLLDAAGTTVTAGAERSYQAAFTSTESFMLKGSFTYTGAGSFGLAFDYNGEESEYKLISLDPAAGKLSLFFDGGRLAAANTAVTLEEGREYAFTYIQDGSVGVFYLDGQASLAVRLYGVTDKTISLFAENNSVTFTSLEEYTR